MNLNSHIKSTINITPAEVTNQFQNNLKRWSVYLAVSAFIIAVLVLVGWQWDIVFFKRPFPNLVAMNPATATGILFAALSFLLLNSDHPSQNKKDFGLFFAFIPLVVGALRIGGILLDIDTHVDSFLFSQKVIDDAVSNHHIAPNTACNLILTGIALLLLNFETRSKKTPSQWIALLVAFIGLLSVLGYLYRVPVFYGILINIPMAIHTAICFLLISVAILFRHPEKGFMSEFTSSFTGSITARLLTPAALAVPSFLGLLVLCGYWANAFSTEFETTVLVLGTVIIFLWLVWYNAATINRKDLQRKESEDALRQSEEQVQTIFRAAPNAVIVIDEKGIIIQWNPKAEELFGWTTEEIIGKALVEAIIPDRDREAHRKGLLHFLETGEYPILNKTIELTALRKDNSEFDAAVNIAPTFAKDGYLFIGFVRDITRRKRAEEEIKKLNADLERRVEEKTGELVKNERRFRALIEHSSDAILMIDACGKIIYNSPATERLLGFSTEEITGKENLNFIHPEDLEETTTFFQQLGFISGIPRYKQHRLMRKNGSFIWTEGTVTNLLHDDSVRAIVSNFRDITDRKNAELERAKMTSELLQHLKDLEQFAYIVSHNLRAPVANLMGICEVLQNGNLEGEERNAIIGGLSFSVKKLDSVILDLNHILQVTHEINEKKEVVQFSELLNDIATSISDTIRRERFVIKSDFTEVGEMTTLKSYIHSIFYNLISNSIKYRRPGVRPVIEIKSKRINRNLQLTFRDNGIGIDLKKKGEQVFGLYKRFHTEVEGKGMGLFMVKTQVETLGGRISIKSEVNQGTEFQIEFE